MLDGQLAGAAAQLAWEVAPVVALRWLAGLTGVTLLIVLVLGIVFWQYIAIAAVWWWIGKRYYNVRRPQ